MSEFSSRVLFIQNFERICRGETTFNKAGLILSIPTGGDFYFVGFEGGHVCVATVCISQSPCDCTCLGWFVGSRAQYFHLRP